MFNNTDLNRIVSILETQYSDSTITKNLVYLYSQHTLRKDGKSLKFWSNEISNDRFNDAINLLTTGIILFENKNNYYKVILKKSGEHFEWLGNILENSEKVPINYFSAVCYHLAGFPARAQGVLNNWVIDENESKILHSFLKNNYLDMQYQIVKSIFDLENSQNEEQLDGHYEKEIVINILRCLGIFASTLRWGEDKRMNLALSKLNDSAKVLIYSSDSHQWLLAKSISLITTYNNQISVRSYLQPFYDKIENDQKYILEAYIKYAFISNKALTWPSQVQGIEYILADKSFALCTPTGSGKTRVAELAILYSLITNKNKNPIVLYLVPSKALAAEVENTFKNIFSNINFNNLNITTMYGGNDWGVSDSLLTIDQANLIISTPEKGEAIIRFIGKEVYNKINCIIIDEAHGVAFNESNAIQGIVDKRDRSLHLEAFTSRLRSHDKDNNCKIIALSAVALNMGNQLASWVTKDDKAKPIEIRNRTTRQLVGRLLCYSTHDYKIEYNLLDGSLLTVEVDGREIAPYIDKPFDNLAKIFNFKINLTENQLMRLHTFWVAVNFAKIDTNGKYHPVLISLPQKPLDFAKTILEAFDYEWFIDELPNYFIRPQISSLLKLYEECLSVCADYFSTNSREYRLLQRGIALHHGKMPASMASRIIKLIEKNVINIVIATSTLSEGINLPFETVLIHNLYRGQTEVTTQEFINLIGRAGRPGLSTEGRCLVLLYDQPTMPQNIKSKKRYKVLIEYLNNQNQEQNIKPHSPIEKLLSEILKRWLDISNSENIDDFYNWLEVTAYDDSIENDEAVIALDTLDGLLISSIFEYETFNNSLNNVEENIKELWQNTFAKYVTEHDDELYQNMLIRRTHSIINSIYPDQDLRQSIYFTGLTPRDGKNLIKSLDSLKSILNLFIDYAKSTNKDRLKLLVILLEELQSIGTFRFNPPRISANNPWQKVLTWWLHFEGSKFRPNSGSESVWYNFGAKNFLYLANWGLGSVLGGILSENHLIDNWYDKWEETGLPWAVLWIKDLLTWGTLDPVIAFLLSEKICITRQEANKLATKYWDQFASDEIKDEYLQPKLFHDWLESINDKSESSFDFSFEDTFVVTLVNGTNLDYPDIMYVLPIESNKKILWYDPAGYIIATSIMPETWATTHHQKNEYRLIAKDEIVVLRRL